MYISKLHLLLMTTAGIFFHCTLHPQEEFRGKLSKCSHLSTQNHEIFNSMSEPRPGSNFWGWQTSPNTSFPTSKMSVYPTDHQTNVTVSLGTAILCCHLHRHSFTLHFSPKVTHKICLYLSVIK